MVWYIPLKKNLTDTEGIVRKNVGQLPKDFL